MTKEEAREELITFIGTFECPSLEAVEMAIEALNREQEKFDAICSELIALKSNLNEPIEVAMAYEKSIAVVRKYALKGFERWRLNDKGRSNTSVGTNA